MDRAAEIEKEWRAARKGARLRPYRRSMIRAGRADPSDPDTWTTPEPTFNALNHIFQFELYPCCFTDTSTCPNYYTPHENGLKRPWFGSVFTNPPYSRKNIPLWAEKAMSECVHRSVVVVMLVRHGADNSADR